MYKGLCRFRSFYPHWLPAQEAWSRGSLAGGQAALRQAGCMEEVGPCQEEQVWGKAERPAPRQTLGHEMAPDGATEPPMPHRAGLGPTDAEAVALDGWLLGGPGALLKMSERAGGRRE